MRRGVAEVVLVGGLAVCGCSSGAFACEETEDCRDGDVLGACQPDGFCSFPDDRCPSGQRYGGHAGALSGECVVPGGETDASTTSTTAEVTVTGSSLSATVGSLDGVDTSAGETTFAIGSESGSSEGEVGMESSSTGVVEGPELVLWLELEDASFDVGIADSGPLGLAAACVDGGCPTAIAGQFGQAARFDATDQCIVVPHDLAFEGLTELTVSAWVEPLMPMVDLNHMVVAKPLGPQNNDSFELYFHDAVALDEQVQARFAGADELVAATALAPRPTLFGEWLHIAGTWDGVDVTLWIAGDPVGSAPLGAIAVDDHAVMIGCDDDVGGSVADHVFVGGVDEVRIYRTALTAEQIGVLAAGDAP